ncbi:hypothetical protein EYR38_010442 [Pleurotus pulmonarius]|nr:hypothetical protein EYR38_010442 [Pleurotus pulmonarius]
MVKPGRTQVQSPPNDNFAQGHGHGHDLHEKSRHEGGPMSASAQHLHKEALRMALGSILNPDTQSSPQDGDQVSHSQRNSPTHSGAASNSASHCSSPISSEAPGTLSDAPITTPRNSLQEHPDGPVHAPAPIKGAVVVTGEDGSPSEKSKVTFIQTLQSKSAWEALIHGSFS